MTTAVQTPARAKRARATGQDRPPRRIRFRPIYLLIAAWVVGVLGPYSWMALTSVTPADEFAGGQSVLLPHHPTLRTYPRLLFDTAFLTNVANSLVVAAGTVVLTVSIALLAGTALSRYRFRGRRVVLSGVLLVQLFPAVLLIVPLYVELRRLGLLDSKLGLILVYTAFALSFTTWLMKGFVDQIPVDVEEASLIDGCNRVQSFFHVILPLARPGILAGGTYAFIYSWNEFLFALTFTSSNRAKTVPVALSQFIGENIIRWDFLASGGVLAAIPILIGFMVAQKGLISGLASGAVKG